MQYKEKINRALWLHFEVTKELVVKNVDASIKAGTIRLDQNSAAQLLSILTASIDEGYHKGLLVFNRELDGVAKNFGSEKSTENVSSVKKN